MSNISADSCNRVSRRQSLVNLLSAGFMLPLLGATARPCRAQDNDSSDAESATPEFLKLLMHTFSTSPGASARFEERKRIALLKEPIINRGRIYYSKPGLLARYIDTPFPSALFLRQRRVILWNGSDTRTVNLDTNPAVAALATSFMSLLAGDYKQLQAIYSLDFRSNTEKRWTLRLKPRTQPLQNVIRKLEFTGRGLAAEGMAVTEVSGDTAHTRFRQVNSKRTFTPAEKKRYFLPPAP